MNDEPLFTGKTDGPKWKEATEEEKKEMKSCKHIER